MNSELQQYDQEIGALKREMASLESQINQKNTELTKLSGQLDQAAPSARRAARANKVALMVDEIVAKGSAEPDRRHCGSDDEGASLHGTQERLG